MNQVLENLSAQELYELARRREEEEREKIEQERREKLEELMAQRREMVARHKAELAALDKEIKRLGGGRKRAATRRSNGSSANLSRKVVDLLQEKGEMNTRQIKAELESRGLETRNISQTLSYLKRQGRLQNRGRGVYGPL
ncbi:hypothetical protein [Ectothiorhodospira mobilis]|uniref:hypothetical protein n=1 Tax=Ectothiorhodospira mobilis TaxID=195064 RepID=UPI0019041212|nr:hypothetical protein [Ectothiorhodospira mobilis]MBK1691956.1 hypothetical protein [Ectothiorhodospira mobilis]